jgi:hypothetical protein
VSCDEMFVDLTGLLRELKMDVLLFVSHLRQACRHFCITYVAIFVLLTSPFLYNLRRRFCVTYVAIFHVTSAFLSCVAISVCRRHFPITLLFLCYVGILN